MISETTFDEYWNRVIPRLINEDVWLIDPLASYQTGAMIVIENYRGEASSFKDNISERSISAIKAEHASLHMRKANSDTFISAHRQLAHPWKVGIELTGKCNFKCIHCYAKPLRAIHDQPSDTIYKLLDWLHDSGVLFVWFTGGECTFRNDFNEIYVYAKNKGFIVSILTNGSMLERSINILLKYPPKMVKVSQYGATRTDYLKMTGSSDNFELFTKGIALLQQNGINYSIQTVITKVNCDSTEAMASFCESIGAKQRKIVQMQPRLGGAYDTKECEAEGTIYDNEILSDDYKEFIRDTYAQRKPHLNWSIQNGIGLCSAGLTECFISVDLRICLCIMVRDRSVKCDLSKSFNVMFSKLTILRQESLQLDTECKSCEALGICSTCSYFKDIYRAHNRLKHICSEKKTLFNAVIGKEVNAQ